MLESAFGIQPRELPLVQAFFLYFTAIGMYAALSSATADTLFLSRLGTQKAQMLLPWVYIGTAANAVLVTLAYDLLKKWFSRVRLMAGLYLGLAASVVALRALISLNADWVYMFTPVWMEACSLFAFSLFFSLAGDYFTSRDARRLYGFITGGLALGFFLAGYLTEPLSALLGVENLLLICAVLLAAFAVATVLISRMVKPLEDDEGGEDEAAAPLSQVFRNPYLLVIFALVIFTGITEIIVDYNMKVLAGAAYGEEQLAAFFGKFWATLGVVSLAVQFLLVGWLLKRVGAIGSLLIVPALLSVCAAAFTAMPALPLATACAFLFFAFSETLTTPSRELLFLPLPMRLRHRAQTMADGALASLGLALGGLILMGLGAVTREPRYFGVAAFLAAGITVVLGFLLFPRYRKLLSDSIRYCTFNPADLESLLGRLEGEAAVKAMLESGNEPAILAALELMAKKPSPTARALAAGLMSSASEIVAEKAIALAAQENLPAVNAALKDPRPRVRAAAIRALCRITPDAAVPGVGAMLDSSQDREAALAGLIEHCGFAGALRAYPCLDAMLKSAEAADRLCAARLLGDVLMPGVASVILRLLGDDDAAVRLEALKAAANSPSPEHLPRLLPAITGLDSRLPALTAIDRIAATTPAAITTALAGQDMHYPALAVLTRSLEYSGPGAIGRLWDCFQRHDDVKLKIVAAKAMRRLHIRGLAGQPPAGLAEAIELLKTAASEGGKRARFFREHSILHAEISLALLALERDPAQLEKAEHGLFGRQETQRANAGELLEILLSKPVARRLCALAAEEEHPPGDGLSVATAGRLMLEDEWSRWLAISAADNGGNMENKNICQLMDKISLLKGAAIFNGMPANYLAAVAEIAEERTLFAGETLFKQGDFGDSLYVVIEGSLSVLAGEKEQARLPAGECIGEMALLDGNPRSASVRAASDARLLRIKAEAFRGLLASQPRIALALLGTLAGRLREATSRVKD
jgi:ATP/ADP translocase/HEAT repeat protein